MSCQWTMHAGDGCGVVGGGPHGSDALIGICPEGTRCTYVENDKMSCRFPDLIAAGAKCGERAGGDHGSDLIVGTCGPDLVCGYSGPAIDGDMICK